MTLCSKRLGGCGHQRFQPPIFNSAAAGMLRKHTKHHGRWENMNLSVLKVNVELETQVEDSKCTRKICSKIYSLGYPYRKRSLYCQCTIVDWQIPAKSNRVNHYPPWISIFETITPGGQSGITCPSMPSWCLLSEVCGIFWSCPYVALAAKEIWKVPTRSMFGGTFRHVVRFLVGNDRIQFVCHNFVRWILDWFHQGGPTQRWSEAIDSIVAKESSNPNLSVSQEGEWNVSVFISFWTLPCLVQAYFLLKV